jgi:uncharacterized protein (DUF1778 family)
MAARTALLIHCSRDEAGIIHERAKLERRGISGYILNIVMRAVNFEETILARSGRLHAFMGTRPRPPGPRTALLLRCSTEESERIRRAAKMTDSTISGFVLYALRLSWAARYGRSRSPSLERHP